MKHEMRELYMEATTEEYSLVRAKKGIRDDA